MSCICFFNVTAPPEIYTYLHTLSLHDALPISLVFGSALRNSSDIAGGMPVPGPSFFRIRARAPSATRIQVTVFFMMLLRLGGGAGGFRLDAVGAERVAPSARPGMATSSI